MDLQQASLATSSVNDFTTDAFSRLVTAGPLDSNYFMSPFSLSMALMMLTLGSGSNSYIQLLRGLKIENKEGEESLQIHDNYKNLLNVIRENPGIALDNIGLFDDRLVQNQEFEQYKQKVQEYYNAEVKPMDFNSDREGIKLFVNERIKEATRGLIYPFMEEPPTSGTVGMLLSAIYFKGKWQKQFKKSDTQGRRFFPRIKSSHEVPFMQITSEFNTGHITVAGESARLVKLPYENGTSMLIVVPENKDGLSNIAASKETLSEALSLTLEADLRSKVMVDLKLPKFEINKRMGLKDLLVSMGIEDIFTGRADLSKISGKGNLYVSKVEQVAVVKVNEEGTEAAAVTSVEFVQRSSVTSTNIIDVNADHPFMFLIKEDTTNTVLFVGIVNDVDQVPS